MDTGLAVAASVLLSVFACVAVVRLLSVFVRNVPFLFLMTGVTGVLAGGTVFSVVAFLYPSIEGGAGAPLELETAILLLGVTFFSYYMCAIAMLFSRFRESRAQRRRKGD